MIAVPIYSFIDALLSHGHNDLTLFLDGFFLLFFPRPSFSTSNFFLLYLLAHF